MHNPFFKRFREFISAPSHSRTISAVVILIIAAAIPLTVLVAQQQQETRQRATTCTPGQQTCGGSLPRGYQQCNSSGTGYNQYQCPVGYHCGGTPGVPGDVSCYIDTTPGPTSVPTTAPTPVPTPIPTVPSGGVCSPNVQQCTGTTAYRQCNSAGTGWVNYNCLTTVNAGQGFYCQNYPGNGNVSCIKGCAERRFSCQAACGEGQTQQASTYYCSSGICCGAATSPAPTGSASPTPTGTSTGICVDFFTWFNDAFYTQGGHTPGQAYSAQAYYDFLYSKGGAALVNTAANQGLFGNNPANPIGVPSGAYNNVTISSVESNSSGGGTYRAWRNGVLVHQETISKLTCDIIPLNIYYLGNPTGGGNGPVLYGSIPGTPSTCGGQIAGNTPTPYLPTEQGTPPAPICPAIPNCNGGLQTTSVCVATASNTCSANNGTQTAQYTTYNGSTICNPVNTTQPCTVSNCDVGNICTNGTCITQSTPTPNPSTNPTPTPIPGNTLLAFSIGIDAIGSAGDNVNPNPSSSNQTPVNTTRNLDVQVFNSNNSQVFAQVGSINYNSGSGVFIGTVDLGANFANGNYTVKVKSDGHLKRLIPGIQNLSSSLTQPIQLPRVNLVAGDIDSNNALNINDYNILLSCVTSPYIANIDNHGLCNINSNYIKLSDLEDNGVVNEFDYNLFLREYAVQSGD